MGVSGSYYHYFSIRYFFGEAGNVLTFHVTVSSLCLRLSVYYFCLLIFLVKQGMHVFFLVLVIFLPFIFFVYHYRILNSTLFLLLLHLSVLFSFSLSHLLYFPLPTFSFSSSFTPHDSSLIFSFSLFLLMPPLPYPLPVPIISPHSALFTLTQSPPTHRSWSACGVIVPTSALTATAACSSASRRSCRTLGRMWC